MTRRELEELKVIFWESQFKEYEIEEDRLPIFESAHSEINKLLSDLCKSGVISEKSRGEIIRTFVERFFKDATKKKIIL